MRILQKRVRQLAVLVGSVAASALLNVSVAAQRPSCIERSMRSCPVPVIIQEFEREQASGIAGGAATSIISHILGDPERYPAAQVDSVIDGLEALALTGDSWAAGAAATRLGGFATNRPGLAARLIRIYRRRTDPLVRVSVMGALRQAHDRQVAVQFLGEVVIDDPFEESTEWAILHLSLMGDQGATKLRELHHSGRVRNDFARSALDRLSRTNYRHKEAQP